MEKVALLKCDRYDVELIEKKLREGFELLGGEEYLKKLIPSGSKVLLKPNLLGIEDKDSPVVTHYAVFEAVIRIIKDYSSDITFGDSPGFGDPKRAAERCGLMEVAERYGVKFDDFKNTVHVNLHESILCKSWEVARAPYEADVVITLPKLKTHAMAFFTGAVKNQFGCISGTQKAAWHTKMPQAENFCKMLLDLNSLVKTSFAILDGIIAMEGNGPRNGKPKELDTIIMGQNLVSVDSTAVRLIGYEDVLQIPVLKEAYNAKYKGVMPEEIEVLGERIEDMKAKNFELCRKGGNFYFGNAALMGILKRAVAPSPSLIEEKCIGCGRCSEVCPEKPRVITMVQGEKKFPKWDMSKCIRCFCCQELCPKGAIKTKQTMIGKMFNIK